MLQYSTKKDILERAQQLIGIQFKDIDTKGILSSGKGAVGNLIQECWFNIPVNSDPRPDFVDAGVDPFTGRSYCTRNSDFVSGYFADANGH